MRQTAHSPAPAIRRIATADVWQSLRQGFSDFEAYRSDVIFLCATYAIIGVVLARLAFGADMLPLLFPLASGFAIVGPLAAVGLYEMSRLREQGAEVGWANAFDVLKAPAIGGIAALGLILIAIFALWMVTAWVIFQATLAPTLPGSVDIQTFVLAVLLTPPGQEMIVMGIGVGFLFALLAMMVSVVSFPLLLDRDMGLDTAIGASFRAVIANPGPMALWGLIVAALLVAGTALVFVGLMVAVPVLGHATWHLYRKLIV
jgi:uncharacterized membrane protein